VICTVNNTTTSEQNLDTNSQQPQRKHSDLIADPAMLGQVINVDVASVAFGGAIRRLQHQPNNQNTLRHRQST